MLCGRCCVTEPRSRPALRLDIFIEILLGTSANRVKRRAGAQDLRPSLLGLYKISLGRYTLLLTFSEEELFFSVPLSPDSPFLVVVSAFVPPL